MNSNPVSRRSLPKNIADIYDSFTDLTSKWRENALCKNSVLSMEDFFSINSDKKSVYSASKAISMCNSCPVQVECLHESMKYNYDGVWGGTLYRQRIYFIRNYLNNDLANLTMEKAKEFVQMAKIQNLTLFKIKRKYRRKAVQKDDLLSQ